MQSAEPKTFDILQQSEYMQACDVIDACIALQSSGRKADPHGADDVRNEDFEQDIHNWSGEQTQAGSPYEFTSFRDSFLQGVRAPLLELSLCLGTACLEELARCSLPSEVLQHIPIEEPERSQVLQRACQHLLIRVLHQAIWRSKPDLGRNVPALSSKQQAMENITELVQQGNMVDMIVKWQRQVSTSGALPKMLTWLMSLCTSMAPESRQKVVELAEKAVTGAVLLKLVMDSSHLGYSIAVPTDARIPASGLAAFCVCPALEINACRCCVGSVDTEVVLHAEWE